MKHQGAGDPALGVVDQPGADQPVRAEPPPEGRHHRLRRGGDDGQAQALGADRLIGTRLVYDAEGRVAGALDGPNCRGAEKVRRLREALGREVRLVAAYGDTEGDRELLAAADQGFMKVFTGRP